MRAWIEITIFVVFTPIFNVALFMRAWIEIQNKQILKTLQLVALFMRAWIEIPAVKISTKVYQSPSS